MAGRPCPSRAKNGQTGNHYATVRTIVGKNLCFYIDYSLQLCNNSQINNNQRGATQVAAAGRTARAERHVHHVRGVPRVALAMCMMCRVCAADCL